LCVTATATFRSTTRNMTRPHGSPPSCGTSESRRCYRTGRPSP
jgi:hypothetical protein